MVKAAHGIETLKFLSDNQVRELASRHGTPVYVYSRAGLSQAVEEVKTAFADMPFGLTIRYAMKANPHPEILKLFNANGIHIDASSEYEVVDATTAGIAPDNILLTSQQLPRDVARAVEGGVNFTATSLHQLEEYGKALPDTEVSIRLNTGLGSGENHRLTTGGIEVGFGIWFHKSDNHGDEIHRIADKYDLTIRRIHIHIGTGSDPAIWGQLMDAGLFAVEQFPDASTLNLGGGFKLAYMNGDKATDLSAIGNTAREKLAEFAEKTGREIHLEIEPGRYLTARAGAIISTIIDQTDTGDEGDIFLRLDTGMTEIIRTSMYGSQHPLVVVPKQPTDNNQADWYVVIGHCCESSDILTTEKNDPETIKPRLLRQAGIGDYMVIEMAGAYCASMSVKGYNSFTAAQEVIID